MKSPRYTAILIAALALVAGAAEARGKPAKAPAAPAGDVAKGKVLFNQQCGLCHSTTPGLEGAAPSLHDVYGRAAASEAKFSYSRALKASGLVWTAANLQTFLANPGKMVPGTAMPINIPAAADRQNIVAYLASLKTTH